MDQQLLLQVLLNSNTSGIMVLDVMRDVFGKIIDFKWRFLNPKSYLILRQENQDLVGRSLTEVIPGCLEQGLFDKLVKVVETGSSLNCECEWLPLRDIRLWLHLEAVKFEEGLVLIFQDYSDLRNTENILRENEERYKITEAKAHIGSWEFNVESRKVVWSDEFFRIMGYEPNSFEPSYEKGLSFIHPDDRDFVNVDISKAIKRNTSYKSERRIIRPDGETRWILSEGEALRSPLSPRKLFGFIRDITERKNREIELLRSENLFRSLFYGAGIGIALVDLSGIIFKANSKFCNMLGYTEEELAKMHFEEFTYYEDVEKDRALYLKILAREIDYYEIEKRYVRKNGELWWTNLTISIVRDEYNNYSFAIAMAQDISTRKLAEQKLVESEEKFKAIFNSTYQFTGLLQPDGTVLEANASALRFAGLASGDITGKPLWETYPWKAFPETQDKLHESILKAAKGEFIRYEANVQGAGGKVITIDFSLKPIKDNSGNVVMIIPEGRDISEKKQAEKLLENSEKQLKLFVNQAPIAIAMFDTNLNYIAASKKWSEDYNITYDLIGKNHYDIFPEIGEDWKNEHQHMLNGKVRRRSRDPFYRYDGRIQWQRWEGRPWYDLNNEIGGLVFFTEDITEDIKNEEAILRLNKELEELNQQKLKLFSIISHDLKGPIANCLGLLDVVSLNKENISREELLDYMKYLETAASMVSELVEELLLWARTQFHTLSFEPGEVQLSRVADKLVKAIQPVAEKKSIQIEKHIDPSIMLRADENMLNTIVRNLISNAVKFTNRNGCVTLESHVIDGFAEISVIDTGIGIKEEDMNKLFSPKYNFTTYGTSGEKGTGLGLDLCQSFVEKHGGKISVRSEVGKGSAFTFTIPVVK